VCSAVARTGPKLDDLVAFAKTSGGALPPLLPSGLLGLLPSPRDPRLPPALSTRCPSIGRNTTPPHVDQDGANRRRCHHAGTASEYPQSTLRTTLAVRYSTLTVQHSPAERGFGRGPNMSSISGDSSSVQPDSTAPLAVPLSTVRVLQRHRRRRQQRCAASRGDRLASRPRKHQEAGRRQLHLPRRVLPPSTSLSHAGVAS
jgi:hypothetical protein